MSEVQEPFVPDSDDQISRDAGAAIAHLDADHADALLDMARALGGCGDATAARCLGADRTGLTLLATTAAGELILRAHTTGRSRTSPGYAWRP